MCGRFVMLTKEELADVVAAVVEGERPRPLDADRVRREAFPGSSVAAFAPLGGEAIGFADAALLGGYAAGELTWGFPVEWQKGLVFNTRIESALAGSGMWRTAIERGRCVVPAASFFEAHRTETARSRTSGRKVKRHYRFAADDGAPLMLAGIGEAGRCSLVTTEPNRDVSPIHARMPLVLRFEEVDQWLEGDFAALSDRSAMKLTVEPEPLDTPPEESAQLTLF